MASLCRIWRGDFAVRISLPSSMRLYFGAALFQEPMRGFPEAMAAAGAHSEPHIASVALASILISLGFNEEAGRRGIARPGNPVAGDPLESLRWPFTMSISS